MAADGNQAGARRTLVGLTGRGCPPHTLQEVALSLGKLAFDAGDRRAALRSLREALEYGRPEQRRWPFIEGGGWVHRLLRQNPALAGEHGWLSRLDSRHRSAGVGGDLPALTDREVEVLGRLAEAMSTEDIADAMYLSVSTVKTHLKNIYRKLGTPRRSAAAQRARELKLLPGMRRYPDP
jgi:LuxR family maltose regulon positive regulatory protein